MIGTDREATSGPLACCCLYFEGDFSIHCHSADEEQGRSSCPARASHGPGTEQ